jgi:hypothetical protein
MDKNAAKAAAKEAAAAVKLQAKKEKDEKKVM